MGDIPDEVTETENQDSHTGKLDSARESAIESDYVVSEHRCEREWTKTLHESCKTGRNERRYLPLRRPIERIVLVGRGLRDEHSVRFAATLDEVMGPNIGHKLGAWKNLGIELPLDRMEHLASGQQCRRREARCTYRGIVVHLHGGRLLLFSVNRTVGGGDEDRKNVADFWATSMLCSSSA